MTFKTLQKYNIPSFYSRLLLLKIQSKLAFTTFYYLTQFLVSKYFNFIQCSLQTWLKKLPKIHSKNSIYYSSIELSPEIALKEKKMKQFHKIGLSQKSSQILFNAQQIENSFEKKCEWIFCTYMDINCNDSVCYESFLHGLKCIASHLTIKDIEHIFHSFQNLSSNGMKNNEISNDSKLCKEKWLNLFRIQTRNKKNMKLIGILRNDIKKFSIYALIVHQIVECTEIREKLFNKARNDRLLKQCTAKDYKREWTQMPGNDNILGEGSNGKIFRVSFNANPKLKCAAKFCDCMDDETFWLHFNDYLFLLNQQNIQCSNSLIFYCDIYYDRKNGKCILIMKEMQLTLTHFILDVRQGLHKISHPFKEENVEIKKKNGFECKGNFFVKSQKMIKTCFHRSRHLSENEYKCVMFDIYQQLNIFHSNNFLHRDIKGSNVMFDVQSQFWKLIDFDFVIDCDSDGFEDEEFTGTVGYTPLEIDEEKGGKYTFAVDVWSTGILLLFLITGKQIFYNYTIYQQFRNKPKQWMGKYLKRLKVKCELSEELYDLMSNCLLCIRAEERASVEQILGHPWFAKCVSV